MTKFLPPRSKRELHAAQRVIQHALQEARKCQENNPALAATLNAHAHDVQAALNHWSTLRISLEQADVDFPAILRTYDEEFEALKRSFQR